MPAFTGERCKAELRTIQQHFGKAVEKSLATAVPRLSFAEVGLQKARIAEDAHWPNEETGYWKAVNHSTSKPPRWILHLRRDEQGALKVSLASKGDAFSNLVPLHGAETAFCINSQSAPPSAGVCAPIWLAIMQSDKSFLFPEDWAWLLVLRFGKALSTSTSSQAVKFDHANRTATTLGKVSVESVPVTFVEVLHINPPPSTYQCEGKDVSYEEATEQLRDFLRAGK